MRLIGEIGKGLGPGDGRSPPRHLLIDRTAFLEYIEVGREFVEHLAFILIAGTDPDGVEAVENIELGQCDPGQAVDPHRIFEDQRIEPPAPARPAGCGAELMPRLAEFLAVAIQEFGRERPASHPRDVGLRDADDFVDVPGTDAGPGAGPPCAGGGRGDIGVRAVVHVQKGPLGTLEEYLLARLDVPVENESRIGNEPGHQLLAGETGEILVRGAPVMLGYWRNQEATTKAFRDGWLLTGDVGSMDGDGFLTLKDRSKDVIISGGSNIYPREVEEALLLHPSVREASVVGRPSEEWGEDVVAFIVAKPGVKLETSELDRHCIEHIARFKRPKSYLFEIELPKNNYGKVLKTELRARLAAPGNAKGGDHA